MQSAILVAAKNFQLSVFLMRRVIPGLLISAQLLTPTLLAPFHGAFAQDANSLLAEQSSAVAEAADPDPFGLLKQSALYEFEPSQANRFYQREEIQIAFTRGERGIVEKITPIKDLRREWMGDTEIFDAIEFFHPQVNVQSLVKTGNYALNSLYIKNRSAVFFGNYLVFIEIKDNGEEVLSVLDLETYVRELGQTKVPILRLPIDQDRVRGKNLVLSQESDKKVLLVGEHRMSFEFVDHFVKTQSVYFNMLANLHSPATYEATKSTIEDLDHFIGENLNLAVDEMSQNPDSSDIDGPLAKAFDARYAEFLKEELQRVGADHALIEQNKQARKEAIERGEKVPPIKKDPAGRPIKETIASDFEKAALRFSESQAKNKKVFSRIRFLVSKLQAFSPRANQNLAAIYDNLASRGQLGAEVYQDFEEKILRASLKSQDEARRLQERAQNPHPLRDDLLKAGFAAGAGVLFLDSPMAAPLVEAFAPLVASAGAWFSQLWQVHEEGARISTAFVTKAGEMWDRMTAPEQAHLWKWRGVGVVALLGTVATLCHFLPISVQIYRDWKAKTGHSVSKLKDWIKGTWEISERGGSWLEEDAHWKKLTEGIANAAKEFPEFLIERQQKDAAQYAETLEKTMKAKKKRVYAPEDEARASDAIRSAEKKSGWVMKLLSGFSSSKKDYKKKEIDSFTRAVVHAFFSMSAATNAHRDALAPIYNKLFYWRSYLRFPMMDWLWLRYPESIRVALQQDGKVVLPTVMNGGLRSRFEKWRIAFQARRGDLDYEQFKAWENAVVDVEKAIEVKALNEAFKLMMENVRSREVLRDFFATGGIEKVTDETIFDLAKDNRVQFEGLYRAVSEGMLKEFLRELAERKAVFLENSGLNPETVSLEELKKLTLSFADELKLAPTDVDALYTRTRERVDLRAAAKTAIETATWADHYRWEAAKKLDPEGPRLTNKQASRIHATRKQLKNPAAVLRAVRSSITELLIDKPIEIAQMTLFLMAVDSGINVLFEKEIFGENSIFGWGRFAFLYGFVWSTAFSYLAAAAMKLQFDEMNQENFENVPEGDEKEKSFLWHYWKNIWRNSDNSWVKNHMNQARIVTANIPSYLTLTIPVQKVLLGRVEFDTLLGGYGLYYFTPVYTVDYQMDQAFEFSAFYDLKDIPEELHHHPIVLDWLKNRQMKRRILFQIAAKATYQNPLGFMVTTIMTLPGELGGKQLMRLFFGGYTPTELLVNPARALEAATDGIPVLEQVASLPSVACETFLTEGYNDGTRLLPRAK